MRGRGFTVVELLVVLAIISIIAAILFPVFQTVRHRSLSTTCLSNLRQIGLGIQQYAQDYDGMYPYADDPTDKYSTIWEAMPTYYNDVTHMSLLNRTLLPYITDIAIWHCPADVGYSVIDTTGVPFNTVPSMYDTMNGPVQYKMSYVSRTEIVFDNTPLDQLTAHDNAVPPNQYDVSQINLIMDGCGSWHGDNKYTADLRYNVLMGDGHAVSMNDAAFMQTWSLVINQ
jgi:prepilin-type N-terminal cleavage/methylation domain-containing protein